MGSGGGQPFNPQPFIYFFEQCPLRRNKNAGFSHYLHFQWFIVNRPCQSQGLGINQTDGSFPQVELVAPLLSDGSLSGFHFCFTC